MMLGLWLEAGSPDAGDVENVGDVAPKAGAIVLLGAWDACW